MLMKPFSPDRRFLSHAKAKNAALINQLATPGLGSLIARRWLAGTGQLFLSVTGCVMVIIYIWQWDVRAYGEVTENFEPMPRGWLGGLGTILFGASWLWSLATSISLLRQAKMDERKNLENIPPKLEGLPDANPKK
jgi:hypothetical protein